ncbi:DUF5362 family protein [Niabella drilacis]|uniref:DUF5362 domain-containing protein n=1 Tax=Niabella drilacis (strain DSM 25811 / CCM 8410 / CCUG 62505 / LMG 26954 / E90) TaxID=1285928 RepID=A0A1G6N3B4_NIADE|nr:DUF5362 family protein [Niabella drilacis]SDC61625.1 hypothetical protein SAMN04487894_103115 [Niabella drilacis]
MENFNDPSSQHEGGSLFRGLEINEQGKFYIDEASKWAKLLGIIGFIALFFILIAGLGVLMVGSTMMQTSGMPISGSFIGLIYIAMALLYFFPSFYLFKFGTITRRGIQTENIADLNEGLRYLKSLFRFLGILTIVIIGFYIIAFLAFGMGALTSRL